MTVTIQLSDKRGDAILVIKSEAPSVEIAEGEIAAAAGLTGLAAVYEQFGTGPVAGIPSIAQLTRPQQPEPWGQPPVQQFQPPAQQYAPPMPAAAAAAAPPGGVAPCQHGQKEYKSGVGAKGPWAFWGCKARQDDPTKCEKEWVR